jgi:5,6-dimethylbenzimidazole synthase
MSDAPVPDPFLADAPGEFSEADRRAVYAAIALRRDIQHFRTDRDIDEAVLERILRAGHLAPSVGLSQPWHFIVVRDVQTRERVRESFMRCREAESARFPAERRAAYLAQKLEGILESSVNLCVGVDLRDRDEVILGTTIQPGAIWASACCAVQNIWLAARVEGIGVGWVSIVEPAVVKRELGLPEGIEPVAYLCMGYPVAFRKRPMLEETAWARPRTVVDVIHRERFTDHSPRPAVQPK